MSDTRHNISLYDILTNPNIPPTQIPTDTMVLHDWNRKRERALQKELSNPSVKLEVNPPS